MRGWKRLSYYLVINVLVSACTMVVVLAVWQHYNPIDQIDRSPTFEGFPVEMGIFLYIMRDIGDVHPPPAPASWSRPPLRSSPGRSWRSTADSRGVEDP